MEANTPMSVAPVQLTFWAMAIGVLAGMAVLAMGWWFDRRSRRRAAEDARRWAVQRQLWDLEQQIWDEQLSEEEHERQRQVRARLAEVQREARRRLGLPEEAP